MIDMFWAAASLVALIAAYPTLVLADVLRRPDRAPAPFQVLHPVQAGVTTAGVPWVAGQRG